MSQNDRPEPIRIPLDEAHRMVQEEDAIVVDVVDTGSYDQISVMIEGAVRIAPEDVPDEYERIPQDRSVLTY
jgi:rhodanese-related sulfurtransferase